MKSSDRRQIGFDEVELQRIQPRIRVSVYKMAKSKCALQGINLEDCVDRLLSLWVKGEINLNYLEGKK